MERGYDFSKLTPEWQAFIESPAIEQQIAKIATKYMSHDEALREDAMQEARIGLATVDPATIKGNARNYCALVIRNSILSYLHGKHTGDLYSGRTEYVKDRETGERRKVFRPSRLSSYDYLSDEFGLQISTAGAISWGGNTPDGVDLDPTDLATMQPYEPVEGAQSDAPALEDVEAREVNRLLLESLLSQLSTRERRIMEAYAGGHVAATVGIESEEYRRLIHKLAVLAGAERECSACGVTYPASEVDWAFNECETCETAAHRQWRKYLDKRDGYLRDTPSQPRAEATYRRLTEAERATVRAKYATGQYTQAAIAAEYDVSQTYIGTICKGVTKAKTSEPFPHGTTTGYARRCRCDDCRRAHADYNREYERNNFRLRRAIYRQNPDAHDVRHGAESTYARWGCNCMECRTANSTARRTRGALEKQRLRRRAERALKQLHARRRTTAERLSRRANDALARLHAA